MENIVIIDFGSQTTQLIARRVREAQVFCHIVPYDIKHEALTQLKPCGVILSGSPSSAWQQDPPQLPAAVIALQVPILGICYGMQILVQHFGGQVKATTKREFGYAEVRARGHTPLLKNIQNRSNDAGHGLLDVWMSHGDSVVVMPEGFICMASSTDTEIAAIANLEKNYYGLQFHPEVTHTPLGGQIIARFVHEICGAGQHWNMAEFIPTTIENIKQQVGSDRVLLGLSGGVDSTVAAALVHRAVGDQLECVFVDTGLLRLNEVQEVAETARNHLDGKLTVVDASAIFFEKLQGVSDPEEKRRVIGHTFIEIFNQTAAKFNGVDWLVQGTIYPDVIESAHASSANKKAIKSHHNVGGLPEDTGFKLLEPLRELFKDEVRKLGLALGLPAAMIHRHPFPGPGLGVRILGEIKPEYVDQLQQADAIFIETLRKYDWYDRCAQAFAVFLPVRSVGVMGDSRTYEHVIALRSVNTSDFMTANWSELPHTLLSEASGRIINEVAGINRVVYDISNKPPATIEWE